MVNAIKIFHIYFFKTSPRFYSALLTADQDGNSNSNGNSNGNDNGNGNNNGNGNGNSNGHGNPCDQKTSHYHSGPKLTF